MKFLFFKIFLLQILFFVTDSKAQKNECLNSNLKALNSISPLDTNFSDLEFLKEILKDVEIVALGEATHGDGTSFEAKTRLVKFLHQEMGFEVLAFESGLYDCHKAWQLIEQGENADTTAGKGVFGIWSLSKQMQPLFQYLEESKYTETPLILTGFDFQFSGSHKGAVAEEFLIEDIKALLNKYNIDLVKTEGWHAFAKDMQGRTDYSSEEGEVAMEYLLKIEKELKKLDENREITFWLQWIKSTKALITDRKYRDKYMAENLIWLKEQFYTHKKFILWGATSHFMFNSSNLGIKQFKKYPRMGDYVKEKYGERFYTIGSIIFEGERARSGWPDSYIRELKPAKKRSLEYLVNEKCSTEHCFLDFKEMDNDCYLKSKKKKSRPFGWTKYMRINIRQFMDAVIFHKKMERATAVEKE
ncbi:MAG: erythromycin esterase family protein [Chitinophagales bacterium]